MALKKSTIQEKRQVGQKGHKGNISKLYPNPTSIVVHKKEFCECGGQVKYFEDGYKAKQKVDIEVVVDITEHRAFKGVGWNDCKME